MQLKLLILLFGYAATTALSYEDQVRLQYQQQQQQLLQAQQQPSRSQQQPHQATGQQQQLEERPYQRKYPVIITYNTKSKFIFTSADPNIFAERLGVNPQRPQLQPRPSLDATTRFRPSASDFNSENSHEKFNTQLFQTIAPANSRKNVVYSPISLQTLLSLVYLGAKDATADELQRGLQLPKNANSVASMFENLINKQKYSNGAQLKMANKIYHNSKLVLLDHYQNVAQKSFDSEIEPTDFQDPVSASLNINSWVEKQTNGRIRNVITPQALDPHTQLLLVNAIYFKAGWVKEFSVADTLRDNFYMSPKQNAVVDMMYTDEKLRYAYIANLKAQVIELPYKNSDLSMMIILPDEIDGLARLETSLNNIDLSVLSGSLAEEQVTLRLPKFRIEFELDMVQPLKNLDIQTLFSDKSDLSKMFINKSGQPMGVSKVTHKAYIDVNEAGSEAAGASFANVIPLSLTKTVSMSVNHPFMFAIRSPTVVYFVGHVVNPLL